MGRPKKKEEPVMCAMVDDHEYLITNVKIKENKYSYRVGPQAIISMACSKCEEGKELKLTPW